MPISLPPSPRILVVTLQRIGDVLLTTPLIRSLRRAWPDARLDVLVFSGTAGILQGNPDISTVLKMPERRTVVDTLWLLARLWKRYDLAVSTQGGDRPTFSALVAGRTHAGVISTKATKSGNALKRRLLHRSVFSNDRSHRVEDSLALADILGIARVPELVCPDALDAPEIFSSGNYAVIHAAPMFRYKQWTPDGWRALAAALRQRGLTVVPIRGPGEDERKYLAGVWGDNETVHRATWPQTTRLLRRARLYVGPDTSVTHLAAAAGCPTVALFGPMNPRVWGPWPVGGMNRPWAASGAIQNHGNVWIVQNPLPCGPCTFEGCERHIGSHSACLDELAPEQVLMAADQALSSTLSARA
jgi:heptosyltransferase-3